jgi:regulator of RNase E activity RraA
MPHEVNVPVEFAGVTVLPGDYVYADRSGAVVIPAVDVADVLTEAARLEELDRASVERSRTEDPARVIADGDAR